MEKVHKIIESRV